MLPWLIVETFKGLGFTAIILFVLKLFASNFLKSWFQRDLESHKASLRLDAEREMAQARAKSETILAEYKEKVAHLSRERVEAVKGVSQRLIAVWAVLEALTAQLKTFKVDENKQERSLREFQAIIDASNEFLAYLKQVEIFFSATLSDRMFEFRRNVAVISDVWGPTLCGYLSDKEFHVQMDHVREERKKLEPHFNEIRAALRELLGVS
jgi:hypothetical protein